MVDAAWQPSSQLDIIYWPGTVVVNAWLAATGGQAAARGREQLMWGFAGSRGRRLGPFDDAEVDARGCRGSGGWAPIVE